MAIYNYFKKIDTVLPDESGPLSAKVPIATIPSANKEVSKVLSKKTEYDGTQGSSTRGQYESFTSIKKVTMPKYALENCVTTAIRRLENKFQGRD